MNGLKIEPIFRYQKYADQFTNNPIPKDQSDFHFYFNPIFKFLSGHHWIIERDSFNWPLDWHVNSPYEESNNTYTEGPMKKVFDLFSQIQDQENSLYAAPGLMPTYAEYVKDDWNTLFGFKIGLSSPQKWMQRFDIENHEERVDWVQKTADIGFLNVDAAYWEIHARNIKIIETVQNHLKNIEGIQISPQDLATSYGI